MKVRALYCMILGAVATGCGGYSGGMAGTPTTYVGSYTGSASTTSSSSGVLSTGTGTVMVQPNLAGSVSLTGQLAGTVTFQLPADYPAAAHDPNASINYTLNGGGAVSKTADVTLTYMSGANYKADITWTDTAVNFHTTCTLIRY